MKNPIKIDGLSIGLGHPPFIIAEMSGNHNQSLDRALEIVDSAAKSGAHAIKIQTYKPETMTLDIREGEFLINDSKSLWFGASLYDLYSEGAIPWEWHEAIFERAKKNGMIAFSTPFDNSSVDFLESLGVPCYKIASFENTDLELIKNVAKKKKPIIISTGMATLGELEECVQTVRSAGCDDIVLLKCTSTYPASPSNTNLFTIPHLRTMFDVEVGLSDHTMGVGVSVASIALGATVIEKHFTLDRLDGGIDSQFSMNPDEMKSLTIEARRAWEALGAVTYGPTRAEEKSLLFRRSLYAVQDIKEGELISAKNVRAIRPGLGLPPKYLSKILNKKVNRYVKKGSPITWDLI
jgi:N-acetylneuraminate synthase